MEEQGQWLGGQVKGMIVNSNRVGTAAMVTSGRFWIDFKERTEFTDRTY